MTSPTPTTTASVYTEQHANTTTENKSLNTNWHLREDSVGKPRQDQSWPRAAPERKASRAQATRQRGRGTERGHPYRGLRVMNSKF